MGYSDGRVDLHAICEWQKTERGLVLSEGGEYSGDSKGRTILGSLSFDPLEIRIFPSASPNRDRFTLAHELGHLLLGHSSHLSGELTIDQDFYDGAPSRLALWQLNQLEWQANFFASCLLLPLGPFTRQFFLTAADLGLRDRGHGPLYVDDQKANQDSYFRVTDRLKATFGVSRVAIRIRLTKLGLMTDARKLSA